MQQSGTLISHALLNSESVWGSNRFPNINGQEFHRLPDIPAHLHNSKSYRWNPAHVSRRARRPLLYVLQHIWMIINRTYVAYLRRGHSLVSAKAAEEQSGQFQGNSDITQTQEPTRRFWPCKHCTPGGKFSVISAEPKHRVRSFKRKINKLATLTRLAALPAQRFILLIKLLNIPVRTRCIKLLNWNTLPRSPLN